jgi:hypothetical protein
VRRGGCGTQHHPLSCAHRLAVCSAILAVCLHKKGQGQLHVAAC